MRCRAVSHFSLDSSLTLPKRALNSSGGTTSKSSQELYTAAVAGQHLGSAFCDEPALKLLIRAQLEQRKPAAVPA